jgi:hypothetical protein
MLYLSAGMEKGWAVVTLFGGTSYAIELTKHYRERSSRQFSLVYDTQLQQKVTPILLADEFNLIGHVLSPATKFEDAAAVDEQWYGIVKKYCDSKGIELSRVNAAGEQR